MTRLWLSALLLQGCFYISEDERRARWDLDGDGVERPADCDDGDPDVTTRTWYTDADGDGYGDPNAPIEACEAQGAVADATDCDDGNAAVHPGADEICNGVDDDCDDAVDEGVEPGTWYEDRDGDGYGDPATAVIACAQPAGHVAIAGDCDDDDDAVHPDAVEVCDGVDNDCNGKVDLEDPALDAADHTWYLDEDGDGWGDEDKASIAACAPPFGYGPAGDCDDTRDDVHPDADEVCDGTGTDENCDGLTDRPGLNGVLVGGELWYRDGDDDGWAGADTALAILACQQPLKVDGYPYDYFQGPLFDCDDDDPSVHPGAEEYCNGVDNNCDSVPDCDCGQEGVDCMSPTPACVCVDLPADTAEAGP